MSARIIFALALVALIAVQANSVPYAAKGGQYEQESVQAQPQVLLSTSSQQLVGASSTQQTTTTTPAVTQPDAVTAQQQQQLYGAPTQVAQQLASPSSPAQTNFEALRALPVAGTAYPSKGQVFYQQPAQIYSSKGSPVAYQLEQRLEAAPAKQLMSQVPATEQVNFGAPSKGQSFFQQPTQVYSPKGGQSYYQQERQPALQYESTPHKGAQVYYTKSQWVAPARQEAVVAPQPLLVGPVKTQASALDYQSAPSKSYHYRPRQPLRGPFKGQQSQQQQYVARPFVGQSPLKA